MGAMIDKVLKLLEVRDMNQTELESRAGLSKNRITVLKDKGRMSASEALRIARALGVRVEYLLDDAIRDILSDFSEQEQDILKMARIIGYEEAKRRLMEAPTLEADGMFGEQRKARPSGGKDGGRRSGA
jgi:transcriptional regulator with XRE-family HTH domain